MDDIFQYLGLDDGAKIGETTSSPFPTEGGMPSFDRVPFVLLPGKNVSLNTFVVVARHGERDTLHYGRVVQGWEFNETASPSQLQKAAAFGIKSSAIRPSESSPRLVRGMEIEILGELHLNNGNLELSVPKVLPQTGQGVYELPAHVIPMILGVPSDNNKDEGLHIGTIESGGKAVNFYLPTKAVPRHIAVLGKTGSGKSYATGVIIEELYKKGIPVISFDVLGDMETTAKELGGEHLVAGQEFMVPYSVIGVEEFLEFIPALTKDQEEIVMVAYDLIFNEALEQLSKNDGVDISYSELLDKIKEIGEDLKSKAWSNAHRRVEAALSRSYLLTQGKVEWPELLTTKPFLNVYVGHLSQHSRNLVVGAAARILQRLRRRDLIPPFVLVLDEAHLFLPSGTSSPSTNVIREMIRTARHDKIGVILITQSPSSMDKQVLLTCNTKMLFALDTEDLRVVTGQMSDLPEEIVNRIPRMERGTAIIVSTMDLMRHPVELKIRTRESTTHVAETPDLTEAVKSWRDKKSIRT